MTDTNNTPADTPADPERQSQQPPNRSWPKVGMVLLVIIFLCLVGFLFFYASRVSPEHLASIDGTRPLLVTAAILSTIAFGGAMLIGSLFSNDGTFQERFRQAREIFLVFSGVFGTVIGFYFGAADDRPSATTRLSATATLQDRAFVAVVSGGKPPYRITLVHGTDSRTRTETSADGWARFEMVKGKDGIFPSFVLVVDATGQQISYAVPLDVERLKHDWTEPAK